MWFLVVLFLVQGCTKEVDFDQIDELEIQSKYIAALTYFDLFPSDFLDEEQNEISQIEEFIVTGLRAENQEYIEKLEFRFQFSNSFSRDFSATVLFFDTAGKVVYQLEPTIDVMRNTNEVATVISVVQPDIEAIYNAYRAGFFIELKPDQTESLTIDSPGILNLQSSLTIYLKIKK